MEDKVESARAHAESSDHEWFLAARDAIITLARSGKPFTSESVLAMAGRPTADPRAIGGLFRNARYWKVIVPTGRVMPATRASRNGGLVREWVGA